MSTRSRSAALFAALGALVAIAVVLTISARPGVESAAAHPGPSSAPAAAYAVSAALDGCGAGWGTGQRGTGQEATGTEATARGAHVDGGDQTFTVTNHTVAGIEVYLQAADTKKVYLDLENIGAAAKATARVTLGSGRYRFVCLPADADPVRGPIVTVGAAPRGAQLTPGMVPVTRNDLIPVAQTYGKWVASRLPVLRHQVGRLGDDAAEGDLAASRNDWLAAHQTYLTLGAAYEAFGALGDAIDGMPAPGRTAANDPGLTGFHRIEALLWPAPGTGARPVSAPTAAAIAQLATDVGKLSTALADAEIDPNAIGLRAHEIVENAIQFDLTDATDAGSGSALASVDAELTGAEQALAPLHSILSTRYDALPATTTALTSAHALVEKYRHGDGSWTPLASLARADRQRLNAALGEAAELLAPVAAICDIRREA